MSNARDSAIRLLQLTMIASVILPAALFAYASWFTYREVHAVADERITRSLDVMQEQSLKVFETVDRTFAEVNEIVRGMSDAEIRAAQPQLQPRALPHRRGDAAALRHPVGRPRRQAARCQHARLGADRRTVRRPRLFPGPNRP